MESLLVSTIVGYIPTDIIMRGNTFHVKYFEKRYQLVEQCN